MPEGRRAFLRRLLGQRRAAEFEVEPGPLGWLIDLWADAGQARVEIGLAGGVVMGLGWPELMAWLEGAGEQSLAPVYRRAIVELSAAYAEVANAAQTTEYQAPYDPGADG